MMHDVTIEIGGARWRGWQAVEATHALTGIAATFSLTFSSREPEVARRRAFRPGDPAIVRIDGETIVTGPLDVVEPRFALGAHTITLGGRGLTGQLVDCSPASTPGEWADASLTAIATEICRPFRIAVRAETDVGAPFAKARIKEGETAADALRRLARHRGVLLTGAPDGALVVTAPSAARRLNAALTQGDTLQAASARFDHARRFSEITLKGARTGANLFDEDSVISPAARVRDPAIALHRPRTIVARTAASAPDLERQARHEVALRAGQGQRVRATVSGWTADGALWRPNTLVRVVSDWLRLDAALLVVSARFTAAHRRATVTELELTPPTAFDSLPLPEQPEQGGIFG